MHIKVTRENDVVSVLVNDEIPGPHLSKKLVGPDVDSSRGVFANTPEVAFTAGGETVVFKFDPLPGRPSDTAPKEEWALWARAYLDAVARRVAEVRRALGPDFQFKIAVDDIQLEEEG